MEYEEPKKYSKREVEEAIQKNNPDKPLRIAISVAMLSNDGKWAEEICLKLAVHDHYNVRGNAILGFGHIARINGELNYKKHLSFVTKALTDDNSYVKGQAHDVADDIKHFLGIDLFKNT